MTFARINLKNSSLWLALWLVVCLFPRTAKAQTLDWGNVDWTAGGLTQSFDIDSNNAGNDITITITGNTSRFNTNFPDDTTNLQGGLGAAAGESLQLSMNKFASDSEFVTVTITFNYAQGVDHVNFSIFDIDRSNVSGNHFRDQIRNIKGTFGSTNNAVAITGSANNTVTSNNTVNAFITGSAVSTDTSATGNGFFNFGNAVITQVSFDYGNAPSTGIDIIQWVGLHDIRYRPIPEVHPALAALLICGLAIAARIRRQTKTAPAIPAR